MKARNIEPGTARMLRTGSMRIGQDLLGRLARRKGLRFLMRFDGDKLVLRPKLRGPGWPAFYYSQTQKSPAVSVKTFFRLCSRSVPPEGAVFLAERNQKGEIVVHLSKWRKEGVK